MSWIDLLRMSVSNLRRRKLRTFLTVLGVVIGTASIVVMISLGLGMQQSLYREVEQSGGLTMVKVRGQQAGDSMMYSGNQETESEKYVKDDTIKELGKLPHVTFVTPVYSMQVMFLKGKYEGYGELVAMNPEGLKAQNIELASGSLPKTNTSHLDLVYGNGIPTMFYEKGSGKGYYDTGTLPEIDFVKDPIFMILDQEGYMNQQENSAGGAFGGSGADGGNVSGGSGREAQAKTVEKHVVMASGVVAGDVDSYNANYYSIYCDLDTLKQMLKKEFAGRAIPGQPTTKSGKPYKEFCYSYAQVKVDELDQVNAVAEMIRGMGYEVETNAEYLDTMKKQFAVVQAVLGGIGAVSLLVAAIGIANTMMMSIYERTKEIGVMKVLGCRLGNIRTMFLMEAAAIGLIGGAVGNLLSFGMSGAINLITGHGAAMGVEGNISYIPWWLVLLSMGFAVMVGVTAGYFPARRAMRLSPLAAIRSE